MAVKFPSNPTDGLLFEPAPGILYIYNAKQSTWARVPIGKVGPATPVKDGLITAEDYNKLLSIILPPPQSTLQGEDCDIVFDSGTIVLRSTDDSLDISPRLTLGNTSQAWQLHENTAGYDWRLNLTQFIQEISDLGNLTQTKISGQDGFKGPTGAAGIDLLDTGPVGKQGPDGTNSPFPGSFTPESSALEIDEDKQNRAIVDVAIEQVDDDENYIVMTRANIGNPDACPTGLRPQDFDSPWILVLDQKEGNITRRLESTHDCAITCRICVSQVYYLNIETIIDTIKSRFQSRLDQMVFEKEKIVRSWLKVMSALFNEQKYALCCALENCITRKRNQDVRRYIEQSRIAAAGAHQRLVISSNEDDKVTVPSDQECDLSEDRGESSGGTNSRVVYGTECEQYLVTMSLDARLHNTDPRTGSNGRWLEARLPPGDYMIEVLDCCANFGRKLKPPPKPVRSPPPPLAPVPPPPQIQQPTTPTPPPPQVTTIPARRQYAGSQWEGGSRFAGGGYKDLYVDIPGGTSVVQAPTPSPYEEGFNRALGYGKQPVDMGPLGRGGPAGSIPPGLRVPFSNTPGGRRTADQLLPCSVELTGRVGNQPGDNPAPHYTGYIGNDCTIVHGFAHSAPVNGCIPKVCPESIIEDTGGSNFSQTNKYTGRVALLHYGTVPGNETGNVQHITKVTEIPAIGPSGGYFQDLFSARTAYIGLSEIFNHSGGLIKAWIPDPDKLSSNNDGGIVVGIRSRKCIEAFDEVGTESTITIPKLYIYRDSLDPENLVGAIDPYLSDLTHSENYNFSGGSQGNARLTDGPVLEPELSKMFFVLANDGLGFYHIHHATSDSNSEETLYEPGQAYTMRPVAVENNSSPGWVNWGIVDLVDSIDDATPDDATYIFANQPTTNTIQYSFSAGTSLSEYYPYTKTGHYFRIRARVINRVDDSSNLKVSFIDSVSGTLFTVRDAVVTNGTYTTFEYELTEEQVDLLLGSTSGYDEVIVELVASGWVNDPGIQIEVSWVEFELPPNRVLVQNDGEAVADFQTTVFSKYLVEGNPDPVEVIVGDDTGEITKSYDPQGELFTASWQISNDTNGMVLGNFSIDEADDWIITVDESDFGDMTQLVASSSTGEELILSQDVFGYPIPAQSEAEPFILCRALTRSCNVQEGFGGRWSIGVINRVKGVNFRICKVIPEWKIPPLTHGAAVPSGLRDPITGEVNVLQTDTDYSWIRKPYIYAPQGEPCGASFCNVKYQYIIGSDGVVVPINGDVDPGPMIDGSRVNIAFVIDQSNDNVEAFEFLGDRADDIMTYFRNSGVENVSAAVLTFGGSDLNGDPVLRQDFTSDNTTVTDAINAAAPLVTVKTSTILAESWGYKYASYPLPAEHANPRNFKVREKQSRSACTEGYSWYYDEGTHSLRVDHGCRAIFEYEYDSDIELSTGDSPGMYAIQYAAESLNWTLDAVKVIVFVAYHGESPRPGITKATADAALKSRPIALFGVINLNAKRTVVSETSSTSNDGVTERVTIYSDGSRTTTITYPDGSSTSSTSATTRTESIFGIPSDHSDPSAGGTGICYENIGTMFSHEDMRNASIAESLVMAPGASSYWDQQPFNDIRFGVGQYKGGAGTYYPRSLDETELENIGSNSYYTIAGRWLGGPAPRNPALSGAMVHLRSSITGNTILATQITDDQGRFAFQVPTKFFPNFTMSFYIDLVLYNQRFVDQDGYWELSKKSTEAGATQYVYVYDGDLSAEHDETSYQLDTIAPKQLTGPFGIRGVHSVHGQLYPSAFQRVSNIRSVNGKFTMDVEFDDTHGGDLDFNDTIMTLTYHGASPCTPSSGPISPIATVSRQVVVDSINRAFFALPGSFAFVAATDCCGLTSAGVLELIPTEITTINDGYSECGNGFLQRFADAILNSIRDFVPAIDADCGAAVEGGPATTFGKIAGIPMNAETLDGRIVAIQASVLALPGTAIRCSIYDTAGRGIVMRSIGTLPTSAWEWHSWQVDNIDTYINPSANSMSVIQQIGNLSPGGSVSPDQRVPAEQYATRAVKNSVGITTNIESIPNAEVQETAVNITGTNRAITPEQAVHDGDSRILTAAGRLDLFTRGLSIKLRDLSSLSMEFINPDTGIICYFGEIKAAVEVLTNELTGATKIVLVDLATFEPYGESLNEPGEIPLVVYGHGVPAADATYGDDAGSVASSTFILSDIPANNSYILVGGPVQTDTGSVGGSQVIRFVDTLNIDPESDGYPGHQVVIGSTIYETLENLCGLLTGTTGVQNVNWHNTLQALEFPVYDFASNSDVTCLGWEPGQTWLELAAVTSGTPGNSHIARVIYDPLGVMSFTPDTGTLVGGIDAPAEIPTETRIDPTEEDFSGYLERFWTISRPDDDPSNPDECSRWKEYCPDCTVVKCDNTDPGSVSRQLIECVDKTSQMRIPLTKYLITPIAPCESCMMYFKQVEWYERGWRTKACCGALVEIDGVQWIVVKRSIGIDDSCGGGESESTPCIRSFIEAGQGHPAIAWPTVDGEEFIGRPLSGFARFVKDPGLSEQIIRAISNFEYTKVRGNLTAGNVGEKIPFILFPRSL